MILQRPDVRASGRLARFSALCPLVLASLTYADVVAWDETTSGDISSNRLDPTRVGLVAGVNVIRGAMGPTAVPDVHDLDYITVTVPEGHRLEALVLREARVGGAFSFVGMQAGPVVTMLPDTQSFPTPLLGWAHFGSSDVGLDLSPVMGAAPGAEGFTGPLPAGHYAFWIMELRTDEPYPYAFAFQVAPIPTPAAWFVGAIACVRGRRRTAR
jgi:hypothetical protein